MNNPATNDSNAPAGNGKRNTRLLILAAVVVIGTIAYTAYYFLHSRYFEETDDAYVASDMVQITSEIPGTVISVSVDNTQQVTRGQALIEIDPADAQIAVAAAEAAVDLRDHVGVC